MRISSMNEEELKTAEIMAARFSEDQAISHAYLKGYGAGFKNQRKLLQGLLKEIILELGAEKARVVWEKAEGQTV